MKFESMADMPEGMRRMVCPKLAQRVRVSATVKAVATARNFFECEEEFLRYLTLEDAAAEGIISDLRLYPEITLEEACYDENRKRVPALRQKASFSYRVNQWHTPPSCCRMEDLAFWSALLLTKTNDVRVAEFAGIRRLALRFNPKVSARLEQMGYRIREV